LQEFLQTFKGRLLYKLFFAVFAGNTTAPKNLRYNSTGRINNKVPVNIPQALTD